MSTRRPYQVASLLSLALALAVAALTVPLALAEDRCTAIAVGARATLRGGTLNTHADDCYDCDFRILRVPAATHGANATRAIPPMRYSYPRYVGNDRGPAFSRAKVDGTIYPWTESDHVGHIPQARSLCSTKQRNKSHSHMLTLIRAKQVYFYLIYYFIMHF